MKNLLSTILFNRAWIRILVLLIAFISTIASLYSPYYQKKFIDIFITKNPVLDNFNNLNYIFIAIFFSISSQFLSFINKVICYLEGSYLQRWLSKKVYSKTLELTIKSKSEITVGSIISIYASDVLGATSLIDDVLPNFISYIIPIILAPIAVHTISKINPQPIFLIIFFIFALNFTLAVRQGGFFAAYKRLAASRVGIVNEWLNNIRSIRILGWTDLFEQKIKEARSLETQNRLKMVTNGSTLNSISYSSPFFINLVAVYILIKLEGKNVSPGEIFSLLWIFGIILTRPMRALPMLLVSLSDCYSSIKRVEKYLQLESEQENESIQRNTEICSVNKGSLNQNSIYIKNLNFELNGKRLLKNISLEVKQGEFIAIVGEVGSGKSLLFQALTGFINCNFEKYFINNKNALNLSLQELRQYFSLVPQDLFIMNANLRDNICLNYHSNTTHDKNILEILKLVQFDLENGITTFSLNTEIGERGVNLSGGQKQRIALARAYYMNRDIILLDDCLSALDVDTEEKIIQTLLMGGWSNKTRILITHRFSIIPYCDRVLFMKNGEINSFSGISK